MPPAPIFSFKIFAGWFCDLVRVAFPCLAYSISSGLKCLWKRMNSKSSFSSRVKQFSESDSGLLGSVDEGHLSPCSALLPYPLARLVRNRTEDP